MFDNGNLVLKSIIKCLGKIINEKVRTWKLLVDLTVKMLILGLLAFLKKKTLKSFRD